MIRKNQKGFTLVELIIAVAILAIVTLAVCGFIVVGSKSYTSANTDIMLQQEAQLALNQISDVIIDTTDSISYSVGTSTSLQHVLKDSEYGGEATDKCLVVVNRNDASSNNRNPSYWFYWSKADEAIYFNEVTVDSTMTADEIQAGFDSADTDKAVLAEHVTDLSIDISQFEENRVVMISMVLKNGNREYSTSNNVTVRNKIALNVVDIDPMKRADEFKINLDVTRITLEPGEHYQFTASVETSSSDKAIEWEFADSSANDATLTKDGSLTIGKSQFESFYVRVIRSNEEYVGQNDRVSKRVKVNVKRVTFVSDNELTAAPGDTVELSNAAIRGQNLSEYCFGIGCSNSDDVYLLDKDSWKITSDAALASIESPGDKKAMVKISPSAKEGDVIVVEAASLRSSSSPKGLGYGPESNPTTAPVKGEWRIKIVDDGKVDVIPMPGNIRWSGSFNDGSVGMIYNWLLKENQSPDPSNNSPDVVSYYHNYVMCARLRETDSNNKDDDRVILFYWSGNNIRFTPDMFDVDLNKTYKLFLQVLVPVDTSLYGGTTGKVANQCPKDSDAAIEEEYFKFLDSNGAYYGKKYEATPLFSGVVSKPILYFKTTEYTGNEKTYPNSDPVTMYHLMNGNNNDIIFGPAYLDLDKSINIDLLSNFTLDKKIKFSVYKGEGDNIDDWTLVAGYNPDNGNYGTSFGGNMFTISSQDSGNPLLTDGEKLIKRTSSGDSKSWDEACGTYHIVLGYIYTCTRHVGGITYICWRNIDDFEKNPVGHYYSQPEAAITLVIDTGLNLPISPDDSWTFFPLPTDPAFPFARKSSENQTIAWSRFDIYSKAGAWKNYIENVKIDCTYKPAAGSDSELYIIKVYTETRTGLSYTRHVYGEYIWRPGGNEWSATGQIGERDEVGEYKTNIKVFRDGTPYLAYFPAPTDSDYPFKSGTTASASRSLTLYQENGSDIRTVKSDIKLISTNQISLTAVELQSKHKQATYTYGTYTWNDGTKRWDGPTGAAATKYDVVGGTVYVDHYKRYVELPLPGTEGFPGINVSQTVNAPAGYYDQYCENQDGNWISYDFIITYDSATGVYEARMTNGWHYGDNDGSFGIWHWKEGWLNWQ